MAIFASRNNRSSLCTPSTTKSADEREEEKASPLPPLTSLPYKNAVPHIIGKNKAEAQLQSLSRSEVVYSVAGKEFWSALL